MRKDLRSWIGEGRYIDHRHIGDDFYDRTENIEQKAVDGDEEIKVVWKRKIEEVSEESGMKGEVDRVDNCIEVQV